MKPREPLIARPAGLGVARADLECPRLPADQSNPGLPACRHVAKRAAVEILEGKIVAARGKGVPSPLLGVASNRPHRHAAWKNVASFRIGNLHAKARIKSNVALPEINSVPDQKLKKLLLRGRGERRHVFDFISRWPHSAAMSWRVQIAEEFEPEFFALQQEVQDAILTMTRLLRQFGPQLGRPQVDTLNGSRHANMKELRLSAAGGDGGSPSRSTPSAAPCFWWRATSRAAAGGDSTAN